MKIIFFGDSVTDGKRMRSNNDAGRVAETFSDEPNAYGGGYVFLVATQLYSDKPNYYQILNRGIGGDRLPQLYARAQLDVWQEKPDVLSILIGANDIVREKNPNPTEVERWGRIYRMLIEDTKAKCPNTKIILCETFVSRDTVKELAKPYSLEVKKIAEEFDLPFVYLQDKLDKAIETYGHETCFYDGSHPSLVGSKVIADQWLEVFKKQVVKE